MNAATIIIAITAAFGIGTLIYLYRVAQDEYAHGFRDGLAAQVPEDQED